MTIKILCSNFGSIQLSDKAINLLKTKNPKFISLTRLRRDDIHLVETILELKEEAFCSDEYTARVVEIPDNIKEWLIETDKTTGFEYVVEKHRRWI